MTVCTFPECCFSVWYHFQTEHLTVLVSVGILCGFPKHLNQLTKLSCRIKPAEYIIVILHKHMQETHYYSLAVYFTLFEKKENSFMQWQLMRVRRLTLVSLFYSKNTITANQKQSLKRWPKERVCDTTDDVVGDEVFPFFRYLERSNLHKRRWFILTCFPFTNNGARGRMRAQEEKKRKCLVADPRHSVISGYRAFKPFVKDCVEPLLSSSICEERNEEET